MALTKPANCTGIKVVILRKGMWVIVSLNPPCHFYRKFYEVGSSNLKTKLMRYLKLITCVLLAAFFVHCSTAQTEAKQSKAKNPYYSHTDNTKLNVKDEEWKKILTADE